MEFHMDIFENEKWILDVDLETFENFEGLKRCGSRYMSRYNYYENNKFIGNPFNIIGEQLCDLADRHFV